MPVRRRARPGDHLVVCDKSGFTFWASDTQKEWNGLRVGKRFWEARHPQDFVRGVPDNTRVDDPRVALDISSYSVSGPVQTSVAVAGTPGDWAIVVDSITGISAGDWIRVALDNGEMFQVLVTSAPIRIDSVRIRIDDAQYFIDSTQSIEMSSPLPGTTAVGNLVFDISNAVVAG